VAFAVIGFFVLLGLKLGQVLFMDGAEAFAWGQRFLAGYGRHPPLTGWIAYLWYSVFPAENWSSYLLSRLMIAVCLSGIYLVARRVLDPRRAIFVTLALMVYPLFLGAKSDRYNNYQVLQAILPWVVLSFLHAYEKRTVVSGVLLGLAGAAASLVIYSGLFGVLAVGLAAIMNRGRGQFFASKTPYAAIGVYLIAVSPHIIWLLEHDFASIRFAGHYVGNQPQIWRHVRDYVLQQALLLIFPIAFAAIALWPWRFTTLAPPRRDQQFLLIVTVAVLTLGPLVAFFVFGIAPTVDWGNPFFALVPVALLAAMPRLAVTQRVVATAAVLVGVTLTIYLIAAATYPWFNFRARPDHNAYKPVVELSRQLTAAWRERTASPLPIVAANLELTSGVAFYSSDHPRPLTDFVPSQAPWIDYPRDLQKLGYAAICEPGDQECQLLLFKFDPHVEQIERLRLTASRHFAGRDGPPVSWDVWIVPPRP